MALINRGRASEIDDWWAEMDSRHGGYDRAAMDLVGFYGGMKVVCSTWWCRRCRRRGSQADKGDMRGREYGR